MKHLSLKKILYDFNPNVYESYYYLTEKLAHKLNPSRDKHHLEYLNASYLLVSPTNCGRTWLRVMVGYYLKLAYNIDNIDIHYLYSFHDKNPHIPSLKSLHTRYKQFHDSYQNQKIILQVRDPRDALISRYYHHLRDGIILAKNVDDYITQHEDLEGYYIKLYNDFYNHQEEMAGFLFIRYEDLKASTQAELSKLISFLGLTPNNSYIEQAIEYASFENMKKMELEGSALIKSGPMFAQKINPEQTNSQLLKVRKGRVGGYKEELNATAISHLNNVINQQLNPIFGYCTTR